MQRLFPNELGWGRFFARWVLGLIFLMAGWWKVFDLTAYAHAERFFVEGFAETWIPVWLLWGLGYVTPFVELVGGAFLCAGLRVKNALVALGVVLVMVSYGHLLKEPLFDITSHIFPRLVLLLAIAALPTKHDTLSLDRFFSREK